MYSNWVQQVRFFLGLTCVELDEVGEELWAKFSLPAGFNLDIFWLKLEMICPGADWDIVDENEQEYLIVKGEL